jgi:Flp pilus assembly protein TadD/4-amino-4-deoxy-L-arabinose transferase-like glycosyltransferase
VILSLAALAKTVVLARLHDHPLLQPVGGTDSAYYVSLAHGVLGADPASAGHAFFVAPLYVYFLAGAIAVLRSELSVRVLQIVLGTAAVWLIHRTARDWFGERAALLAAALAAGTGLFTFHEILLLHAALDPFLTALVLFAVGRAVIARDARWFLAAGVAIGLQALNRPNAIAYAAVVAAGSVLTWRTREGLRHAAAFACGVALILAPVTLRNYARTGELVIISSHGGLNFYIGNNPDADGTYRAISGITPSIAGQAGDAQRVASEALGHKAGDAETSGYFYDRALEWMGREPGQAARLWLTKAAYVLNAAELTLDYSFAYYQQDEATPLRVLRVGAWVLVPLGAVGLFARRTRSNAGYWLWAAFLPTYALTVVAFFVSSRYRMPLLVPLAIGAGAAIDRAIESWRERQVRALVPAAVLVAGLSVVSNYDLRLDDGRWEERTAMVVALIDQGRFAEAEAAISRFAPTQPDRALLYAQAGRAYREHRQADRAIVHFQTALALDTARPEINLALGQTLLDTGRAADAVPHLRRAYDAGVRRDVVGYDLARALAGSAEIVEAGRVLESTPQALAPDAEGVMGRADLALLVNRPDLACTFLSEAAARWPRDAAVRLRYGLALIVAGQTPAATGQLEEAVRLDPGVAAAHLNLAVLYAQTGRTAEAATEAREALRLQPDYPQAEGLLRVLQGLAR